MDWWERRRRKPSPWFDIFEEFDRLEEMLDEFVRRAFEPPITEEAKKRRVYSPYVYGFSLYVGPDGKPVVRQFGNVQPGRLGPRLREEREPLVDVVKGGTDLAVFAELPGVEKDDILLNATEDTLTISVDTEERKYRKELQLPVRVDPRSARATYKNGVLEVRFVRKGDEEGVKGEKISVE